MADTNKNAFCPTFQVNFLLISKTKIIPIGNANQNVIAKYSVAISVNSEWAVASRYQNTAVAMARTYRREKIIIAMVL